MRCGFCATQLFSVLQSLLVFLTHPYEASWRAGVDGKTYQHQRGGHDYAMEYTAGRRVMCFQCHMPLQCATGFCYGDFCVKSLVADKYVSKGCENRSYSSSSPTRQAGGDGGGGTGYDVADDGDYATALLPPPSSPSSSSSSYLTSSLQSESACHEIDIFGVPNTICYCNNEDFCNGALHTLPHYLLPALLLHLLVVLP